MDHSDLPQLFRMLAALIFVLGLMGGLVVVLRKLGIASQNPAGKKRLKLIETLHLDSRRKLAIVQRDEKQHLIIMGPAGETLIESGVESGQDVETVQKDKQ